MKGMLYALILALTFFAPVKRLDISKLEPVEAVAISRCREGVRLQTDTGALGEGVDVTDALADLKDRAKGVIYLDTAEYLLAEEGMQKQVESLMRWLKKDVRIAKYRGGDIREEAEYLDAHRQSEKPKK